LRSLMLVESFDLRGTTVETEISWSAKNRTPTSWPSSPYPVVMTELSRFVDVRNKWVRSELTRAGVQWQFTLWCSGLLQRVATRQRETAVINHCNVAADQCLTTELLCAAYEMFADNKLKKHNRSL
jgi:hypothetical protein